MSGTIKKSAPTGIRILVLALRGPRPGPLDDGGERSAKILSCLEMVVNQKSSHQVDL